MNFTLYFCKSFLHLSTQNFQVDFRSIYLNTLLCFHAGSLRFRRTPSDSVCATYMALAQLSTGRAARVDVNGAVLDPDLVGGYVGSNRPVDQFSGTDVKAGEV